MRRRGPSGCGRQSTTVFLVLMAAIIVCVFGAGFGGSLPHLRMALRGGKGQGDGFHPAVKSDELPKTHAVKRLFSEFQETEELFSASSRGRRQPTAKRITVRGGKAATESSMQDADGKKEAIDEVLGHDAMRRMQQARILLVGMGGLGVEIAKDLVLAGVKGLTIHDDSEVQWTDLSSQFYCAEEDVGMNRAEVSLPKIASLNRNVAMDVLPGPINAASLDGFSLVICSDKLVGECVKVNDACRQRGIKFIMAQTRGVFSNVFVDFGSEFEVVDTDGENPLQAMISAITQEQPATITTLDEQRHGFTTGDEVSFAEVQGMHQLNELGPLAVTVTGPYSFTVDVDASKFGAYTSGGYAKQVKKPATVAFKSLREALLEPDFTTSDFAKMDRERQALLGFQAIDSFKVQTGGLPRPGVKADAEAVVEMARQFNADVETSAGELINKQLVEEVDARLVRLMAYGAQGQLAPMASVVGSVVAQEALKAISGKFMPVRQFLVFDAEEALPAVENEDGEVDEGEFAAEGGRYDGQVACLGKGVQEQLGRLSYFLVGAGAIGCEMLKNWAMMGVACGEEGGVHCTDMDVIEKSNLNRQFLFRPTDIQQLKSAVACARAKEMNPNLKIHTYATKVGPDTENTFGDEFFESLDGVCNALDNVQARMYMDQRCIYFRKSLLESGTLGTKGNVQVVIPDVTESYGSSRDPPEKAIPICTLKNFPNAIEHTIQWARDDFEGTFKQSVEDAATYKDDPAKFLEGLKAQPTTAAATVQGVKTLLGPGRPQGFQDCVKWARLRFQELYYNQIRQLLFNFPLDMTTAQGAPFWSGAKRPPSPLEFDSNDQSHLDFVIAAARLRAINFDIAVPRKIDEATVVDIVSKMKIPEFEPKKGVKIATTEAEETGGGRAGGGGGNDDDDDDDDDDRAISGLARALPPAGEVKGVSVVPIEFEKDDDAHIDFVTACSNLRASNYNIAHADKHNTKLIAGKIIPAIATSTSLVTGLVCLELYKLLQKKPLESFKNGFVNLALPFFGFSEPLKAPERKYQDETWNLWSRFDIDGKTMTLGQFLAHFKDKYKLEVSMVSCGVSMIYSMFSPKSKSEERMAMTMADIVTKVANIAVGEKQKYLMFEICVSDEDGEEVDAPSVRLALR